MQTLSDESTIAETAPIKPTLSEVCECRFSSWYPTFRNMHLPNDTQKHRKNVTIESIVISPLPEEFIEYLRSDGVRLPDCATQVSSCMNDTNTDDAWEDDDCDDGEKETFSFPSLTEKVQTAINTLSGEGHKGCMPKLNWSSPKDATWINCGSLKCTKPGDVYLLLKSSEFVAFDLERAWLDVDVDIASHMENNCVTRRTQLSVDNQNFELVLRKWCNLHPSMEFRCFVYNHELIAVSQRHPSKFYSHLQQPSDSENSLLSIIRKFFGRYVQKRFADGKLHRYVLDLYIDSQERTWIVDFNVWGSRTDGLLFDWEELSKLGLTISNGDSDENSVQPKFRVVTKDMKSMTYDPLSSFRGPTDVIDLLGKNSCSSDGFEGNTSFEDFMKLCVRPSEM